MIIPAKKALSTNVVHYGELTKQEKTLVGDYFNSVLLPEIQELGETEISESMLMAQTEVYDMEGINAYLRDAGYSVGGGLFGAKGSQSKSFLEQTIVISIPEA